MSRLPPLSTAAALLVLLAACGPGGDLDRGREALDRNDLGAAEAAFSRILEARPDDPEALYGLGWTFHVAGRREEARRMFERCLQAAPDDPLGYKGLGSAALAERDLAGAERWFADALTRAPGDPAIRNSLALVHLEAGHLPEALALYDTLRREHPADPALALGQAQALVRAERPEEALAVVDAALAGTGAGERTLGLLHALRARILVVRTAGGLDPTRCAETVPPVHDRLDEATRALDAAAARAVPPEDLLPTRRLVVRRREEIGLACPSFVDRSARRGEGG